MITVYLVISNNGDGSSSIQWFKNTTIKELELMEEEDPELWSSGDGLQIQELTFPDNFNFEEIGVSEWRWYD